MRAAAALPIEVEIDERSADMPNDVAVGLDRLATSSPLWPVDGTAWLGVVERVRTFACQWDARARTAGWSALDLYGLHRRAPYANLAGMGGAFVVARCGHHVIDVAADAIQVRSPSGADLRIYRRQLDAQSVLAWSLL
jgi:hypothetical protein